MSRTKRTVRIVPDPNQATRPTLTADDIKIIGEIGGLRMGAKCHLDNVIDRLGAIEHIFCDVDSSDSVVSGDDAFAARDVARGAIERLEKIRTMMVDGLGQLQNQTGKRLAS